MDDYCNSAVLYCISFPSDSIYILKIIRLIFIIFERSANVSSLILFENLYSEVTLIFLLSNSKIGYFYHNRGSKCFQMSLLYCHSSQQRTVWGTQACSFNE